MSPKGGLLSVSATGQVAITDSVDGKNTQGLTRWRGIELGQHISRFGGQGILRKVAQKYLKLADRFGFLTFSKIQVYELEVHLRHRWVALESPAERQLSVTHFADALVN